MVDIRELLFVVVSWFSRILNAAIFIRVLFSWLPINMPDILYQITEPILGPIRNMLNNSPIGGGMMLDLSPVIAILLIEVVTNVILGIL